MCSVVPDFVLSNIQHNSHIRVVIAVKTSNTTECITKQICFPFSEDNKETKFPILNAAMQLTSIMFATVYMNCALVDYSFHSLERFFEVYKTATRQMVHLMGSGNSRHMFCSENILYRVVPVAERFLFNRDN